MRTDLLSPSAINTYNICPKKYYYSKQEIIPIKTPIQPILDVGREFHDLISQYYHKIGEKSINPTKTQVEELCMLMLDECEEISKEERFNKVSKLINGFAKFEMWRQGEGWNIKTTEERIQGKGLCGIVDAIFNKDGRSVIVDWKTGLSFSVGKQTKTQLGIYKTITNADEVMAVKVAYNRRFKFDIDEKEILNKVEDVRNKITQNKFPKNEGNCDVCEYSVYCWAEENSINLRDI